MNGEMQSKISRSQARHIRRTRLTVARKTTENNSNFYTNDIDSQNKIKEVKNNIIDSIHQEGPQEDINKSNPRKLERKAANIDHNKEKVDNNSNLNIYTNDINSKNKSKKVENNKTHNSAHQESLQKIVTTSKARRLRRRAAKIDANKQQADDNSNFDICINGIESKNKIKEVANNIILQSTQKDDFKDGINKSKTQQLKKKSAKIDQIKQVDNNSNLNICTNNINNKNKIKELDNNTILHSTQQKDLQKGTNKSKAQKLKKKSTKIVQNKQQVDNNSNLNINTNDTNSKNKIEKVENNVILNSNQQNDLREDLSKFEAVGLKKKSAKIDQNKQQVENSSNIKDSYNLSTVENDIVNDKMMNNEEQSRHQLQTTIDLNKVVAKTKNKNVHGDKKSDSVLELTSESSKNQENSDLKPEIQSLTQDNANLKFEHQKNPDPEPEIQSLTQEKADNLKLKNKEQIILSREKSIGKSKSELRAERRAKQEAQRSAKASAKDKTKNSIQDSKNALETSDLPEKAKTGLINENATKKTISKPNTVRKSKVKASDNDGITWFQHISDERRLACIRSPPADSVHPAIVRLGIQYSSKIIVGSNARCVALLAVLKELLKDYERPLQADFTRGLESNLQDSIAYLHNCRPLALSMINVLKQFRCRMNQLPATISDEEAKNELNIAIDTYINKHIVLAGDKISKKMRAEIHNNDVILTYGYSSLIQKIICDAFDAGIKFEVVVVDGRPWLEGLELLQRLVKHGVSCFYVLINGLSHMMPKVTKVLLGAHAILANGVIMSRAGTGQVALMANAFNVPVIVACESHKISTHAQVDSIVYNEIGNAYELVQCIEKSPVANWQVEKSLNVLNILYDITPADLVNAVISEL